MKKLMIIILMGIIMIIPFNTHAYEVPVYQLDQKIKDLNNYTLREVYQNGNDVYNGEFVNGIYGWYPNNGTLTNVYNNILVVTNNSTSASLRLINDNIFIPDKYYAVIRVKKIVSNAIRINIGDIDNYSGNIVIDIDNDLTYKIYSNIVTLTSNGSLSIKMDVNNNINTSFEVNYAYVINLNELELIDITKQQLDYYFKYYRLALQYELDNKDAVKDPGQYKHIFMSIYEGLTNLMRSMGSVWRFLTTPFVDTTLSDMDNLFSIDWSWDIFDVLRQWITNMAVWILQLNAVLIGTLFLILGIPIKVSILSLVFSDLVFVIIGWIMIKSFII